MDSVSDSVARGVSGRRSYGQACPVAATLDLLGNRWTLLILRDLAHAPMRFRDLQAINPGLAPNLLSTRLREMTAAGIVTRRSLPAPFSSTVYELLPDVRSGVLDVLSALGRFGATLMDGPESLPREEMLLRQTERYAHWIEAKQPNFEGDFALELNGVRVGLTISHGGVSVSRDPASSPVATLRAPVGVVALVTNGGLSMEEAEDRGLSISGDRGTAIRLIELLTLS